jgi:hypothetical protein
MPYITLPPKVSYPSPYADSAAFRPGPVRAFTLGQEPLPGPSSAALNERLNALRAQTMAALQQKFNGLTEKMKKEMVKSAGYQTVGVTALSLIPVVGWLTGPIAAIVGGVSSAKYMNEAKQIMADTKAKVEAMRQRHEQRVDDMINRVFRAEYPAAVKLAMSGQPLQGLGCLHGIGGLFDKVSDFMQEEVYDPISGRSAKTAARDQRDKILKTATEEIYKAETAIGKFLRDPAMRQDLRINLAEYLRQTPEFQQYMQVAAEAGVDPGAGGTLRKVAVPAVAAGAVIATALLLD